MVLVGVWWDGIRDGSWVLLVVLGLRGGCSVLHDGVARRGWHGGLILLGRDSGGFLSNIFGARWDGEL